MNTTLSCDELPAGTLTVEQAQARILDSIHTLNMIERVQLHHAQGRILAESITSNIEVPPFDNSSMDGYAINTEHLTQAPHQLTVVGTSLAGKPYQGQLKQGECIRIMTGAMMPQGANASIMQENVTREGTTISFTESPKPHTNVRFAGDDIKVGDSILEAGRTLNAADLGLIASLGLSEIDVLRRPRIAFFSTGDELQRVGNPLQAGQIYDSNRYTLRAMLQKLDVELLDMGVVRDEPEAVEQAFTQAMQQADMLITSGGVSVGDADYVTQTLEKLGAVNFWKMAMKPGKPLAYGKLGNCLFFGLPGNPVSVMATFLLFVRPSILKLRGNTQTQVNEISATTTVELKKSAGRKDYQRGICHQNEQGEWLVSSTGMQESHLLRSMSQANCFIVLPREMGNAAKGSNVGIIRFNDLL